MDGIINLDKPAGISSAKAVWHVKRLLPKGARIGHAGTLDPFATGVLLLLVGKATKLCEQLIRQPKSYEATVKLGATTATDDADSQEQVARTPSALIPSREDIEASLKRFIGSIEQRPPAFCALKVGGRRAYQLARDGNPPVLAPRTVEIYSIELLDYAWPLVRLRIECGRGTYIRSIARDLGEALGVGGYLTQLRRTRVGEFRIEDAVSLEQLKEQGAEKFLRQCQ
jgi:tRNA pseudouridine55 synthase